MIKISKIIACQKKNISTILKTHPINKNNSENAKKKHWKQENIKHEHSLKKSMALQKKDNP